MPPRPRHLPGPPRLAVGGERRGGWRVGDRNGCRRDYVWNLFFFGATQATIIWMESNAQSELVLAAGGAIYGIPVGIVLGIVIGLAVLLTERGSEKPADAVKL